MDIHLSVWRWATTLGKDIGFNVAATVDLLVGVEQDCSEDIRHRCFIAKTANLHLELNNKSFSFW